MNLNGSEFEYIGIFFYVRRYEIGRTTRRDNEAIAIFAMEGKLNIQNLTTEKQINGRIRK